MFDAFQSQKMGDDSPDSSLHDKWLGQLTETGFAIKADVMKKGTNLTPPELLKIAHDAFDEVNERAVKEGFALKEADLGVLVNRLVALGQLTDLIASRDVEDIAINLGHIYAFTTSKGWQYIGPADNEVSTLRVELGRQSQRAPTYDIPIQDAMLRILVWTESGPTLRNVRVSFIDQPVSPYGPSVTLRISRRRTMKDLEEGNLSKLTSGQLPPIPRPAFEPKQFPETGKGVLSSAAANYLLSLMVNGGTLVVAGSTGSGKTYVAQMILQEMLSYFPKGTIRLFIVEDSQEIVLNGWDGDPGIDTQNIVYTITRPETIEGPPEITMYDLVRAALRARPHGLVIGEARGPEAWELVRAASTGHGHSAFTIHATDIDTVWPRFLQVARAHPDATGLRDLDIAEGFSRAVNAILFLERNTIEGQIATEIAEVQAGVDPDVGIPVLRRLFSYDFGKKRLIPTGYTPLRKGFDCKALNLPPALFQGQ